MTTLTQHLADRHLLVDNYSAWLSDEEDVVVFPLYNLAGQMFGYHHYRRGEEKALNNDPYESRYFTRVREGYVAYWGVESWTYSNTLYVVEGLFDAARLHSVGLSALAVFCNNPVRLHKWLDNLARPVVAVCDGDKAGIKMASNFNRYVLLPEGEDVSSLSDEAFKQLLKDASQQ
jgi:DNA primase